MDHQSKIRLKVKTDTGLNILCTASREWKVSHLYGYLKKLFMEVIEQENSEQPEGEITITKIMRNQYYIPKSQIIGQIFVDGDEITCVVSVNIYQTKKERMKKKKQQKKENVVKQQQVKSPTQSQNKKNKKNHSQQPNSEKIKKQMISPSEQKHDTHKDQKSVAKQGKNAHVAQSPIVKKKTIKNDKQKKPSSLPNYVDTSKLMNLMHIKMNNQKSDSHDQNMAKEQEEEDEDRSEQLNQQEQDSHNKD